MMFGIYHEEHPLTLIDVGIHVSKDPSTGVMITLIDQMYLVKTWYNEELGKELFKLLSEKYIGKSYWSLPGNTLV